MQKSDLKTGVVYAFQRGKYDTMAPVVLLSTDLFATTGSRFRDPEPGSPRYVATKATKPENGYNRTVGYLAVSTSRVNYHAAPAKPISQKALLALTVEEALAATVHGGDGPQGYTVTLVNNRHLIGLYDVLAEKKAEAERANEEYLAKRRAEDEAAVAAALPRYERLAALGIEIPKPVVTARWTSSGQGSVAENVRRVTIDVEVLDQILALLPVEVSA